MKTKTKRIIWTSIITIPLSITIIFLFNSWEWYSGTDKVQIVSILALTAVLILIIGKIAYKCVSHFFSITSHLLQII